MKLQHKLLLGAFGVAVAASAATVATLTTSGLISSPATEPLADVALPPAAAQRGMVPVVASAGVPTDFTQAAESTINGVVSIKSYVNTRRQNYGYGNGSSPFDDPFFDFFFGGGRRRQQPQQQPDSSDDEANQQQSGLGSGVIITPEGHIVTNNHVINGADRLEVTLNDNRTFPATVVGTDELTDLALIKIDAEELPVIPMGDSDALKVGEWVLAVGNPFGLTSTVTSGIVSAKARSISDATHSRSMGVESYIQTDAAVNPGNSGGALVNLRGELVGINTAIYSQTGNYAGHSFAIPTAIVNKVVGDIKQYGAVQRAFMGVVFRPLDAKLAKEKGIKAVNSGIYIEEVQPRSAALEAGLEKGDVIVSINNTHVGTDAELRGLINRFSPGDEVAVTYIRDNKEHTTMLRLLNSSGSTTIARAGDMADLGCTLEPAKEKVLKELGLQRGLEVAKLTDGLFKSAGIRQGYIIVTVNRQPVAAAKDVESLYKAAMKSDDKVLFITGYYPGGKRMSYAVNLEE